MKEVRPADTISQTVINRILSEIRLYGEGAFADDKEGWENAAKAIVASLLKGAKHERENIP